MKNFIVNVIVIAAFFSATVAASFAADAGADVFKAKCGSCHGPDGKGDTAMGKNLKLKDLGSADVQKASDADLTNVIAKGKKPMPGYEGKLTSDQIQDLVKYVRSLKKKNCKRVRARTLREAGG
jgi:mono/diheme cytochrome c family protein